MPKKLLISGAGIAGATLAFWLSRSGWSVSIVERAAEMRSSGSPVDVRGEALSITAAMGVDERLRASDTGVSHAAFVDATGRTRASMRTRRAGASEIEIARADLAAAVLDTVRPDVELLSGDTVTALTQHPDGVDVTFERSMDRRFDLVVGADGVHSTVRRLAFGPETAYARPFGMAIGTVRADIDIADPTSVLIYNEPGRMLAVHPAGGHPGAAFIFRTDRVVDQRDQAASKKLVADAYADVGWLAPSLLDRWRAADDVYVDMVTRMVVPTWHRGRIALLGDAASCLSLLGEGSSNAIIGAHSLASAVGTHGDDHTAAFSAYEQEHRRNVRRAQRGASIASRFLVPATAAGIRARNAMLRLAPG
ncbi:FAD-dependent monooxygenase [Diaminobutyricibacter sp. McL0608]|uniref:FAD-dependent monooxygenase n=1 Tax=Leifsonia sp. McL0608 TaxID=3143537 RepID=UPI0031F2D812